MIAIRLIFISMMVGGLGLIVRTWQQSATTTQFGTVTGRIVSVDPNKGNIKSSTRYFEIVYEYRVAGRVYQSDRYAHSEPLLVYLKHEENRLIKQHVAGDAIQVFFDVSDPGVSVLRKGAGPLEWYKGCFGSAICLVSIMAMLAVEVARKSGWRRSQQ